jgi:hypothetical protein
VLAGLLYGERPANLALAGIVLALPAIVAVSVRTVLGERLTAMRLGGRALAGVCVSLIAAGGAS